MPRIGIFFALAAIFVTTVLLWDGGELAPESTAPEPTPEVLAPGSAPAVSHETGIARVAEAAARADRNRPAQFVQVVGTYTPGADWRAKVVSGDSHNPLSGVHVWAFPYEPRFGSWRLLRPAFFGMEQDDFLQRHATRTSSDLQGNVMLPFRAKSVVAIGKERFGTLVDGWRKRGNGEVRLSMYSLDHYAVKVVQPNGQPVAGARIGLESEKRSRGGNLIALTDTNGHATVPIDSFSKEELIHSDTYSYVQSLGFDPITFELNASKEILVNAPPARSLTVKFRHPNGGAVKETMIYQMETRAPHPLSGLQGGCLAGQFTIPLTAPGALVSLRAHDWNQHLVAQTQFRIPSNGTGPCEVEIPLHWSGYSISGRLLGPDQQPIVHGNGVMSVGSEKLNSSNRIIFTFTTDADGRFHTESKLPSTFENSAGWFGMEVRMLGGKKFDQSGFFPDQSARRLGPTDVGDLQLGGPVVLAEGILVDQFGKPDTKARLKIITHDFRVLYAQEVHRGRGERNPHGEFQFLGPAHAGESGPMHLVATRNKKETRLEVFAPAKNIHMVVRKQVDVRGKILCDSEIEIGDFSAELRLHHEPSSRVNYSGSPDFRGDTYTVEDIPEGIYDLVLLSPSDQVLITIPSLSLGHPEDRTDLPPLDVRGLLNMQLFEVVNQKGTALKDAWHQTSAEAWQMPTIRGQARVLFLDTERSIRFGAPGYQDRVVSLPTKKSRIVLEKGFDVILGPPPFHVPEGWRLSMRLVQVQGGSAVETESTDGWTTVSPSLGGQISVPAIGDYQLKLAVVHNGSGRGKRAPIPIMVPNQTYFVSGNGTTTIRFPNTDSQIQQQINSATE